MAAITGGSRDNSSQSTTFSCTNFVEDYSMDCDGLVGVVADTLATLIRELGRKGIINADIA